MTAGRSSSVSSVTIGKGYLEAELLFLSRRERVHIRAAGRPMVAECLFDQGVDVGVGMHRVVMEERELFDAGLFGQRQGFFIRRMSEPRVGLVLLGAVLRVVDQQVRITTPVGEVFQGAVAAVGEQRDLVVGGKREAGVPLV